MVVAPANHIDLPQMNCYMFGAKSIKIHQKSIHWIWKIGGKFMKILGIWNSAPNSESVTGITILAVQAEAAAREEKRLRLKQAEDGEDGEGFKNSSWWCIIAGWIAWNDINSLDIYGGSKGCAWNDWAWKRIGHLGGNCQCWKETTFSGRGLLSLPPAPAGWDKGVRMIWWRHDQDLCERENFSKDQTGSITDITRTTQVSRYGENHPGVLTKECFS